MSAPSKRLLCQDCPMLSPHLDSPTDEALRQAFSIAGTQRDLIADLTKAMLTLGKTLRERSVSDDDEEAIELRTALARLSNALTQRSAACEESYRMWSALIPARVAVMDLSQRSRGGK